MVSTNPLDYWQGGLAKNTINSVFGGGGDDAPYSGPDDTPGTSGAFNRHPDWETMTQTATDVFRQSFKNVAGRDPTAEEIANYTNKVFNPALSGNLGKSAADSTFQYTDLANMANNYINTNFDVDSLRRDKGKGDAPGKYGDVSSQFNSILGRDATQEEKDHFGQMLASGEVDSYTLGQWLQQLPENVKKQDEEFRKGLSTELQGQDKRYFEEQIMPSIQSQFAQQGRSVESSGFANALGQQATAQNRQREGFLSNLTASQYGGNRANAYNEYANSMGQVQGNQDYNRMRSDALSDQSTNRIYEQQNYNTQKRAYDEYLRNYGKRSGGGASGAIGGAAAGASIGSPFGPWGTGIGAIGGGLAGYFA